MRDRTQTGFLGYLVYGVVLCALVLIPWVVVDSLLERLPFASKLTRLINEQGALQGAVLWVLVLTPALAVLGWLLRNRLWTLVQGVPFIGEFLVSTNRVIDVVAGSDGSRRDLCVWVSWPSDGVRAVGLVTGQVESANGEEALSVYIFPGGGTLRGGLLRIVSPESVSYPGWTVDEAIAFVTTGVARHTGRAGA